ncbi:MAG TPA: sensor histidine kinase N-terminal domain-containing protein [Steroidobacteraceae bacterium]|nr:sensor histidine kinase N-terminal domain-containing protein [Steroidobacteraceae bacterium]
MNDRSLRVGLLSRLGPVLVLLLTLDAVACYFTALHFANLVYDRWLIDSTRSLAQAVRSEQGRIEFDVPRVALQIFQFDEVDRTYFKIVSARRGFLAGDNGLPGDPAVPSNGIRLADATLQGQRVRVVSTRIAPPGTDDSVTVSIAETLIKRTTLARDILLAMVAPQVALVGIASLLAWLGISRGLKPLTDLAAQIEARDQNNLTPVPQAGLPREARVLAERINALLVRVDSAIRAHKRFVADAAHQLRTPLAAVMLHAEWAQRAPDGATEREALRALHRSVERAGRVSQQLLSLARTDPGATNAVELKPLDLVALARRVGEEWIPRALKRDIDFGLIVPDTPVRITGDDRLLSELLSNLIDNALRYSSPAGRVSVIVEAGLQPKLAVQDDGPGIPEDERVRIFERFYRMPGSEGDGCGLGLAIVEEIARLHSSTVEVSTGSDARGSRFTVVFGGPPLQRSS